MLTDQPGNSGGHRPAPLRPTRLERRRGDRLALSLPVIVRATDGQGKPLEYEGRTVSVNPHGAAIEIGASLEPNQALELVNPSSRREARFRLVGRLVGRVAGRAAPSQNAGTGVYAVMGPLTKEAPSGQAYGAQWVDTKTAFWGVFFAPLPSSDAADAQVGLECLRCRKVQSLRPSIVEMEVLESGGSLSWPCPACGEVTVWGYPRNERAGQAIETGAGAPSSDSSAKDVRRPSSRLPIRIRRASGQIERSESEEVSKTGFTFSSRVDYEIGEAVFVACPENPADANAETPAQIARKQEVRGTDRKIFGVRYALPGS